MVNIDVIMTKNGSMFFIIYMNRINLIILHTNIYYCYKNNNMKKKQSQHNSLSFNVVSVVDK